MNQRRNWRLASLRNDLASRGATIKSASVKTKRPGTRTKELRTGGPLIFGKYGGTEKNSSNEINGDAKGKGMDMLSKKTKKEEDRYSSVKHFCEEVILGGGGVLIFGKQDCKDYTSWGGS